MAIVWKVVIRMAEKIYSLDEIKEMVSQLLHKYGAHKAVLFGSYARNSAGKDSDIDVLDIFFLLFVVLSLPGHIIAPPFLIPG